jgi:toxin CcdB
MAQFDVHINLGRNRSTVPYVVNVQSRRFDAAGTRLVAPLMRQAGLRDADPGLAPKFVIRIDSVFLNPLLLFAAPVSALGPVVASLSADQDASRIIAAIDQVISQAFG